MVSNVSERLNANIVVITNRIFAGSLNSPAISNAKNVSEISDTWYAEPATQEVNPIGIPIKVVRIIPIRIAPLTFRTIRAII